jgi:hypothetical protein
MELVGDQGELGFTHVGWTNLINLALQYGWKPAGAQETELPDDLDDDVEDENHEPVEFLPQQLTAWQAREADVLAQAFRPVMFESDDPILNSYFNNAGFRVTAEDARAL